MKMYYTISQYRNNKRYIYRPKAQQIMENHPDCTGDSRSAQINQKVSTNLTFLFTEKKERFAPERPLHRKARK